MELQVFNYNNNPVTFDYTGTNKMINATEMAKVFGKRPGKWLELPSSKKFLTTLKAIRKSDRLIITENGVGTWMHEDVALEFARWLSPSFAIWCNDRIKELLQTGSTSLKVPKTFAEALRLAADQQEQIESQKKLIEEQKPKVLFTDAVIGSESSCLIGELAKIITQNGYEIGQNRMFKWLRKNGYLGTKGEYYNIPNQRYIQQGLFEVKKGIRIGKNAAIIQTITPKVTGKGVVYFVNKFLDNIKN